MRLCSSTVNIFEFIPKCCEICGAALLELRCHEFRAGRRARKGNRGRAHRNTFFARTGESLASPPIGVIHYLEFLQIRNRWIYPDIGYVDFAHNNYREFFIGGGRTLIDNKLASWDQELLYLQATGSACRLPAALVDAPPSLYPEMDQRDRLFHVSSVERFGPVSPGD